MFPSISASFNNKLPCTYKSTPPTPSWEHTSFHSASQMEGKDGKMSVQISSLTVCGGWEVKGGGHDTLAKSRYVLKLILGKKFFSWYFKCDLNPES